MAVDRKLLGRIQQNTDDVWFDDLCRLAQQLGFVFARQKGSHKLYKHPRAATVAAQFPRPMNFQCGKNGKANGYQVRQLLEMAKALKILDGDEGT